MSSNGRGAVFGAPAYEHRSTASHDGGQNGLQAQGDYGGQPSAGGGGGGGPGGSRKKRRRQRAQRTKRRPPQVISPHGEGANRERIYQDIEGLLRQIRELAEDGGTFSAEQLADYTQAVTGLGKALEGEGVIVSDRVFGDYQRVRDRLSQALRVHGRTNGDYS